MKQYAKRKPVTTEFYTLLSKKGFIKITGKPVKLTFFGVELDAVLHNAEKDETDFCKWTIIEQQTGLKIQGGKTQKEAIELAEKTLRHEEDNAKANNKTPESYFEGIFGNCELSPRYQLTK